MKKIFAPLFLLLLSIVLVQCQRELSSMDLPGYIPDATTPRPLTATVQGNIFDENGRPAAGVTIKAGAKTTTTDVNGYFRIAQAQLDEKVAMVTAEKAGYFKGIRTFAATQGTNHLTIKLLKKNLAGTVSAATGGTAALPNGTIVSLPANGVVQAASNSNYIGDVQIYASYIDPSSAEIARIVPGSFTAVDKEGRRSILTSYGMVAVELESATGEKLQLKNGSAATITMAIPAAGVSSAPATIPLWFVDEQTGLWKEEGTATRQGNVYVGEVKHFSFWNVDVSATAVTISLKVVSSKNFPLVHVPVRITRLSNTNGLSSTMGYTDSLGQVSGYVPSGENLKVEILDPCGNAVYVQNVAALNQSTNIGAITMPGTNTSVVNFTGTLVNCSGVPVSNGFAIINFDNTMRYAKTDATGKFETTFVICQGSSNTSTVVGIDEGGQQQSATTNVPVAVPTTTTGSIVACGTLTTQFINYTLQGTNYSINTTNGDSLFSTISNQGGSNMITFNGYQTSNNVINKISFSVVGATAPGNYPLSSLAVQNAGSVQMIAPFNIAFTSFASAVGQYYEGSFVGQFRDSATVKNISSTFRVRRNN